MTSPTERMERHPDIMAMRMRYERMSETPAAQVTDGLGLLAGIYLALSPWIVGFHLFPTITMSNLLTGVVVTVLAFGLASALDRWHRLAWVAPVIGIWTVISPWVVAGEVAFARVVWNNIIVGAVILLLGLVAVVAGMRRTRTER